jgi:hypothetical protein
MVLHGKGGFKLGRLCERIKKEVIEKISNLLKKEKRFLSSGYICSALLGEEYHQCLSVSRISYILRLMYVQDTVTRKKLGNCWIYKLNE